MQQRTYSRLTGSVRGSGSQVNDQMQNSSFLPGSAMRQPDLPTTFINAPTSLTNLAQLSGISLVPINERRTTLNLSSNNSQIISFNSHQPKITVSPRSRQNHSSTIQRAPGPSDNIREQPTYNLNTIPSIQLLNRVTTDHQRGQRVSTVPGRIVDLKPKKTATIAHSQPRLDTGVSNHRTFQTTAIPGRQTINRSQISSSLVNQISIPRNSDEQSFHTDPINTNSTGSGSPSDDVNDNISLLRLMAIFNNPALTITPVGPTSTTAPHHIDSNPRASISTVSLDQARWPISHVSLGSYPSTSDKPQVESHGTSSICGNPSTDTTESGRMFGAHRATMSAIEDGDNRVTDHRLQSENPKFLSNGPHTVTLSWSPNDMVKNNMSEPKQVANLSTPVDRVENLLGSVIRPEENNLPHSGSSEQTEQECMTVARKADLKPLKKVAISKIISHRVFSKNQKLKTIKRPIISTKRKLYVPRVDQAFTKKIKLEPSFSEIEVDTIERDIYVSERHCILTKIDEIAESPELRRNLAPRPKQTFVESTDKYVSVIDTIKQELEEKSRPEEDDEATMIKYGFGSRSALINEALVLPIQLPLNEEPTEKKLQHLSLLGLVSRHEKNKIIAQQSEDRLRNFSSLDEFGHFYDADGDVQRIVDTLIQTGGNGINLRTETDIKRNELPFIEGLNRNTSRIKMTFMNALGLEKRSKRTTLYKVVKPQEVMTGSSLELKAHNDLSNTVKSTNFNHIAKTKYPLSNIPSKLTMPAAKINQPITPSQMTGNGMNSINASGGSAEILRRAIKLAQASCREALHMAPNKDEYMKSLGLMAS